MGLKIKLIKPAQAASLAQLHKQCFEQSWTVAEFSNLMKNSSVAGLVYLEDNREIGLALLQTIAKETEILTFGIIPKRRGKGFGYGLLAGICDHARALGSQALFLEVSSNNQPAINLYRGYGFEQVGRRKQYYADRSDALICRMSLPDSKL